MEEDVPAHAVGKQDSLAGQVCPALYALKRFSPIQHREERFMFSTADVPSPYSLTNLTAEERLRRALADLQSGRAVVLMDDFDRENEADLIVAAEKISVETMALLIRECSGIVCLCLQDNVLNRLDLKPMVTHNESRFQTAFTVSIDARHGVTTGVSAKDRCTTIQAAVAEGARPEDLVRPGHVFPLRAVPRGVLARRGHTEGSVDLVQMAGLKPAAVLCELVNPDGTMAKGEKIERFAQKHELVALTIEELVRFRREPETGLSRRVLASC
jgi:3,4-dihydroxy 2-butanone 4-phosphate synthase